MSKVVATFPGSPALVAAEREGVTVEILAVGGGFAFEVCGAFENAGAFVDGDGEPFATVEAALAAANDPDCENVSEFYGD